MFFSGHNPRFCKIPNSGGFLSGYPIQFRGFCDFPLGFLDLDLDPWDFPIFYSGFFRDFSI